MIRTPHRKYITYVVLVLVAILLLLLFGWEEEGQIKSALKSFIRAVT
ncbi:MAG: hypothetical protein WA952_00805 [Lewinella sp.]